MYKKIRLILIIITLSTIPVIFYTAHVLKIRLNTISQQSEEISKLISVIESRVYGKSDKPILITLKDRELSTHMNIIFEEVMSGKKRGQDLEACVLCSEEKETYKRMVCMFEIDPKRYLEATDGIVIYYVYCLMPKEDGVYCIDKNLMYIVGLLEYDSDCLNTKDFTPDNFVKGFVNFGFISNQTITNCWIYLNDIYRPKIRKLEENMIKNFYKREEILNPKKKKRGSYALSFFIVLYFSLQLSYR